MQIRLPFARKTTPKAAIRNKQRIPNWIVQNYVSGNQRSNGGYYTATGGFATYGTGATTLTPPASLLASNLDKLRAISRYMHQNSDAGSQFVRLTVDGVLGARGLALRSLAEKKDGSADEKARVAIEKAWQAWSGEKEKCSFNGQWDLFGILGEAMNSFVVDGEAFVQLHTGRRKGLSVEVVDTGRIPTWFVSSAHEKGLHHHLGILIDHDGRRHSYLVTPRILRGNEGQTFAYRQAGLDVEAVMAKDMLHLRTVSMPESLRSIPLMTPVADLISSVDRYMAATVKHALASAVRLGYVKTGEMMYRGDKAAAENLDEDGEETQPEAGNDWILGEVETNSGISLVALPPGTDILPADEAQYPHAAMSSFMKVAGMRIAAGVGVAHHALNADLSGISYSAARVGELQQRRRMEVLRQGLIRQVLTPLFNRWLERALLLGNIAGLKPTNIALYRGVSWSSDGWTAIDEEKQARADSQRLAMGLTSRSAIIRRDGGSPVDIALEREKDIEMFGELSAPAGAGGGIIPSLGNDGLGNDGQTSGTEEGGNPTQGQADDPEENENED